MGTGHVPLLVASLGYRVAGLLVPPDAGADAHRGGGRLALARRLDARRDLRPVGGARHGDVFVAGSGTPAPVASRVAADHRSLGRQASAPVRDAGARRSLRQRLRVCLAESVERGVHRLRGTAAERARAGGRLRPRGGASGALRASRISRRLGVHLRPRAHGAARRRGRPRLAARRASHRRLVGAAHRGLRLEPLVPEGERDRERPPRARAVRGPRGARQRAHEDDDRRAHATPLERRARARLLAPEPRPAAARHSPRGRHPRHAVRRHAGRGDHTAGGAGRARPRGRVVGRGPRPGRAESRDPARDGQVAVVGAVRRAGRAPRARRLVGRRLAGRARP